MPVVHVICATLKPDASDEAIAYAVGLARGLADAEGAMRVIVGRSTDRLVVVTWLASREALEPFAASPAHMSFIMRGLAPCIAGMWSAGLESDTEPPSEVAAMWVFALQATETLFEWQVRDLLRSVDTLPGVAAAGPTVEERERYRAGGAVCIAAGATPAFASALAVARATWGEVALVDALVDVMPT